MTFRLSSPWHLLYKEERFMVGFQFINMILFPILLAIPAIILYFVIKLAVKNAIKELKAEDIL